MSNYSGILASRFETLRFAFMRTDTTVRRSETRFTPYPLQTSSHLATFGYVLLRFLICPATPLRQTTMCCLGGPRPLVVVGGSGGDLNSSLMLYNIVCSTWYIADVVYRT